MSVASKVSDDLFLQVIRNHSFWIIVSVLLPSEVPHQFFFKIVVLDQVCSESITTELMDQFLLQIDRNDSLRVIVNISCKVSNQFFLHVQVRHKTFRIIIAVELSDEIFFQVNIDTLIREFILPIVKAKIVLLVLGSDLFLGLPELIFVSAGLEVANAVNDAAENGIVGHDVEDDGDGKGRVGQCESDSMGDNAES